jgi:hypothetical protein
MILTSRTPSLTMVSTALLEPDNTDVFHLSTDTQLRLARQLTNQHSVFVWDQ